MSVPVCVTELQEAGLLEPNEGAATPQPPRKKSKNLTSLSPFSPNIKTPKRRIAHTPKHPPHTVPKPAKPNTHLRWDEGAHAAAMPGPHNAFMPQSGTKKKNKKKKTTATTSTPILNPDQDFPRNFQNGPQHWPAHGGAQFRVKKSPGALFGSQKSRKKMRRDEKRARKASQDPGRDDENLFLIKQRKRTR